MGADGEKVEERRCREGQGWVQLGSMIRGDVESESSASFEEEHGEHGERERDPHGFQQPWEPGPPAPAMVS